MGLARRSQCPLYIRIKYLQTIDIGCFMLGILHFTLSNFLVGLLTYHQMFMHGHYDIHSDCENEMGGYDKGETSLPTKKFRAQFGLSQLEKCQLYQTKCRNDSWKSQIPNHLPQKTRHRLQ